MNLVSCKNWKILRNKIHIHKYKKKETLFFFVFIVIFLAGIFFRCYHFSDWLHFETDQVDDVLIVGANEESNIGNLAILGPKAGAEMLRVPGIFYYLEFISIKIFGNSPTKHALPVLVFSILAIPAFFFLIKKYFSNGISLALTSIFASSFFLISYGRFSWNPNLLPFFSIIFLLAMLEAFSRNGKNKEIWFLALAFILGFSIQLHFNAFFIFIPLVVIFIFIVRPKFSWKYWLLFFCIFSFTFIPYFAHEYKTKGSNTKLFFQKINGGGKDEQSKDNKMDRLFQDFRYIAGNYFLIVTGVDKINGNKLVGSSLGLNCVSCSEKVWPRFLGYLFIILGFLLMIFNIIKEKDEKKKWFLILFFIFFIISSIYFWNILNNKLSIYPRFFLVITPLPFIFLGLIFDRLIRLNKYLGVILVGFLVSWIVFLNVKTFSNYAVNASSVGENIRPLGIEDIFPNFNRVTINLQKKIVVEIMSRVSNRNTPVYILSEKEYEPVYWYFLNKNGIEFWKNFDDLILEKSFYAEGRYFIIFQTVKIDSQKTKRYLNYFEIIDQKNFGSLTFFEVYPKKENIVLEKKQDIHDRRVLEEKCIMNRLIKFNELLEGADYIEKKLKIFCQQR